MPQARLQGEENHFRQGRQRNTKQEAKKNPATEESAGYKESTRKESSAKTTYKTKSRLAVPIIDSRSHWLDL
jgi:hypothetical protein